MKVGIRMKSEYRPGEDQEGLLGVTLGLAVRPRKDVQCGSRLMNKDPRRRDLHMEEGRRVRKSDVALDGQSGRCTGQGGGKSAEKVSA